MDQATARGTRALIVAALVYAAVAVPIGIHKGGDLAVHLSETERILSGEPLYAASPAKGAFWPPFTLLALTPLALVARASLPLAKAAWVLFNVACLAWSMARGARLWGWTPVLLAILAVAKPLQANFEHLNITVVLLALLVGAAADLAEGRPTRAGAWVGVAAAVKIFPGLLLLYLAYRRHWKGVAVGGALGAGLTLVGFLPYGPREAVEGIGNWIAHSAGARETYGTGQPLVALASEAGMGWDAAAALALAALVAAALALSRRPPRDDTPYEPGIVALVAVLLSPIAWFYYHTLDVLAWVAALAHPPALERRRLWYGALVPAGLLTSGVLTFGLYPEALWFVKRHNYTLGTLLLLTLLVLRRSVVFQPRQETP